MAALLSIVRMVLYNIRKVVDDEPGMYDLGQQANPQER
jgi:hypothetical protein